MVFPGPALDGKSLYDLFEAEKVTFSAGVPTVWLGLLNYVAQNNLQFLDLQAHRDRRLGLSAGHDEDLAPQVRRRSRACVGHDRDVAARHLRHAAGAVTTTLPEEAQQADAAKSRAT